MKRSREDAHLRMIPIHEKLLPLLVESNALGCELERDAVERHSPPELLRQQMRDERRRDRGALPLPAAGAVDQVPDHKEQNPQVSPRVAFDVSCAGRI